MRTSQDSFPTTDFEEGNAGARIFRSKVILLVASTLLGSLPPLLFERYTFYLYATANPDFFNYSGSRLWFDLIWFAIFGALSALIVGRRRKISVIPPLAASLLFIIFVNLPPLCDPRECYVSSTDGLAALRDFLLLGSMAVISCGSSLDDCVYRVAVHKRFGRVIFPLMMSTLLGYALSFYPLMHIFAGVTVPYPENYLQWVLAGAPAGLAGSTWVLGRVNSLSYIMQFAGGILGVLLGLALAIELPCGACGSYAIPALTILLLCAISTLPALIIGKRLEVAPTGGKRRARAVPAIITSATIAITIILLWSFFLASNYEASVVNGFEGTVNSSFSPFEVGSAFVYSGGYLAIPRVVSHSGVGVSVSFGNTTIANYPNEFLAAGIGDQSPNCCKDGLDLAYRADVIEFSNGTEAVLARAWWACDLNMACGGYSWQQMLHFGAETLPHKALSNWVELEMNWTSPTLIQWFYRIDYPSQPSPWLVYSSYTPPKIQNHYWDAGLYYVGVANQPTNYAYFMQFGVSSAYPIKSNTWQVYEQCPKLVLNNTWVCAPKASFINGDHSFWKVLYTFGETYRGVNFNYLGNHEVEFYYSGSSPPDGSPIW